MRRISQTGAAPRLPTRADCRRRNERGSKDQTRGKQRAKKLDTGSPAGMVRWNRLALSWHLTVRIDRAFDMPACTIYRTSVLPLRLERNHLVLECVVNLYWGMYVMHKHSRHRKCSPARNSVCAHNHEATAEIGSSDRSCARFAQLAPSAAMRPFPPPRRTRARHGVPTHSTIRTTAPNSAAPVTGPAWSCTAPHHPPRLRAPYPRRLRAGRHRIRRGALPLPWRRSPGAVRLGGADESR